MEDIAHNYRNSGTIFHFERPRLNELFIEGVKHPLVVVCAGAGYGKSSAVHDFSREYKATTLWIHFSELDNVSTHFWENFIPYMEKINLTHARAIAKIGFPDTPDKMEQYIAQMHKNVEMKRRILVLDDFHFIESPAVIRFFEYTINNFPSGTSVFIITRNAPGLNIAGMLSKGHVFNISENDLRFTENELADFFRKLDITPPPGDLREIMQDTGGWAFAINLVARSFQKAPGYKGYLRKAVKSNIFRLMETEIWDGLQPGMQRFLVSLSLIHHLSLDLIVLLAGSDDSLIADLEKQNAYIRRDVYIHAYVIHPLFLEFLATKQNVLTHNQIKETYAIAGNWCNKNGFKIDALSYFEKIADYASIVSIFSQLPMEIPYDIAKYAADIFDRTPVEAFVTTDNLTVLHIRSYICQGLLHKSIELIRRYEEIFLKLPKKEAIRNDTLAILYFSWGTIRKLLCVTDDVYDFDIYYEKFCSYKTKPEYTDYEQHCPGPWTNACGSPGKGSLQEFIDCLGRSLEFIKKSFNGFTTGEFELAQGELLFYRGDLQSAPAFFSRALELARTYKQYEVEHRALVYIRRLNTAIGNYTAAENALKEMKARFNEKRYPNRYINYDLDLTWHYCILGMPENIPDWLKQNFSPYKYTGFIANYINQMKAWYYYSTRNYPPLLSYFQESKTRESFLYGRVEMLAMESCIYYKMKDKEKAYSTLDEAYAAASPNEIIMPFIELGKDMRTLTASAIKDSACDIPKSWLELINRKAATYAKRQAHVISEYLQINNLSDKIILSPREKDILADLSHGLSRMEIASVRNLSINTVKMVINNIYGKIGAKNITDLIRIAVEKKMI